MLLWVAITCDEMQSQTADIKKKVTDNRIKNNA